MMTLIVTFVDNAIYTFKVVDGYQMPRADRGVLGPIYAADSSVWLFSLRNLKSVELWPEQVR